MKKFAIWCVAMILILTTISIPAMATTTEVDTLKSLGIIEGYEDGGLNLEGNITRAEFAAMVTRAFKLNEINGINSFVDVPASHWAIGYINACRSQGIINGYDATHFGPENPVLYEQAVKMLINGLGYEVMANSKGGYPNGHIAAATNAGLLKNAKGVLGEPATRGTVITLIYNALNTQIFDQKSWNTNGENEFSKTDDTLLSKQYDAVKWEGKIISVPMTDFAEDGYDKYQEPEIVIEGYSYEIVNGKEIKSNSKETQRAVCEDKNVDNFLGKKVIAYISEIDGEDVVISIAEDNKKNKTTTLNSTQLIDSDDNDWDKTSQISYRKVGSNKVYDEKLAPEVDLFINYKHTIVEDYSTEDLAEEIAEGGTVQLINADGGTKIDTIIVTKYTDEAVIKDITDDDNYIVYETYTGTLEDIDLDDKDSLTIVYKNNKIISPKNLKKGDTISIVELGTDIYIYYVSTKTLTGEVESYSTDDEILTIDNTDYELSSFCGKSFNALKDEEGTFYLNVNNQIVWSEGSTKAAGNYGLLLALAEEKKISGGYTAQIASEKGTINEYDIYSKVKFYQDGIQVYSGDTAVVDYLANRIAGSSIVDNMIRLKKPYIEHSLFEFTIKNGKITKVEEFLGTSQKYSVDNSKEYDSETMTYGAIDFARGATIFSINTDENVIYDTDIEIGRVSDYIKNEDSGLEIIAFLEEGEDESHISIGFNVDSTITKDSHVFIVSSIKHIVYDDDTAVKVTGLENGKEKTYTIYNNNDNYKTDPSTLNKGDVILLSGKEISKDCERIFNIETGTAATAKGDIYNCYSNIDPDKKATATKFYIVDDVDNSDGTWRTAGEGISIKSNTVYTLVDFSDSTKNPTITKKTGGSSLFNTSKYDTSVFLRVYEDKLIDVVVYRK